MDEPVRLLVTGDLHLGIHPSGIPEAIDGKQFSPGTIWQSIVDRACRTRVDAIVITGDVIDRANQFYEAWGPFESGLEQLAREGIPVFLIAGNHDSGVLEAFVDSLGSEYCSLIGQDGSWDRASVDRDDEVVLYLDGWSYPTQQFPGNPLDEYDLSEPEPASLGLLHTELNNPGAPYAPVSEEELEQAPVDGWLLGHIHRPRLYSDNPLILNPGSPQPLNPTEPGIHGPWEIEVRPGGDIDLRQLPMATLQYLHLELDVSELEQPEDLAPALKQAARSELDGAEISNDHLEALALRVVLTGEFDNHEKLSSRARELLEKFRPRLEGAQVFVEKLENEVRPCLDLESLAEGASPAATLAELILELDETGFQELPEELRQDVEAVIKQANRSNAYKPLRLHRDLGMPGADQLTRIVRQQAYTLLRELRRQKESNP